MSSLNANFADYENNSSIINTDVAGTTISTSSRLGYRWLNGDRSWMYGLNAGYDSRPHEYRRNQTRESALFGTEKNCFLPASSQSMRKLFPTDWTLQWLMDLLPVGDTEQKIN